MSAQPLRSPARRRMLAQSARVAGAASITAGALFAPGAAADGATGASPASDAAERLRQLMHASDEAHLDRNPIDGLFRGDTRRAARFGNYGSPAYVEAERRAAERDLAALAAIPRPALGAGDQVTYDTFRASRENSLQAYRPPSSDLWPLLLLDHYNGWHLSFAELSSGQGVAPYKTVEDYEAGLSRLREFVEFLDRCVARLREGQARRVVLPRFVVERMVVQFETFAAQPAQQSPYCAPVRSFPEGLPAAERERLTRAYEAALEDELRPAFVRVHAFLRRDYIKSARITVGLSALPGGAAYYAQLVRWHTTTSLGATAIHELGLAEVERIGRAMDGVMRDVGYRGTRAQFFHLLRTDSRFTPASAQALAAGYMAIGARVEATLPRLFDQRPGTPLELRPVPDYSAPTAASAYYTPGALETGKPGIFYFNTHDLPQRPVWNMETLYLHEAVPGHHFQGSLAAEDATLPSQQRYGGPTAYLEGWALYAESLGFELGLFADPYQRFGHYNDEMLRAMRLVVDTGLHMRGWSRQQAIDYMLSKSALPRLEAESEVERYIVDPGQALSYKIGSLTIQRLRRECEKALGARFDLRAFHREVLSTGAVPMTVLEAKIARWSASVPVG